MNKITLARDIIVSIGAALAAGAAMYGIGQWRAEIKGRAKVDLATRLGKSASRFEALLGDLRSPIGIQWNKWESATQSLKPLHGTYVELMEGKWEAQILMRKAISDLLESIAESYRKLREAVEEHFYRLEHPDRVPDSEQEGRRERERLLWMYGGPEDDKARILEEQVKQLVVELRKEIGSESKWCRLLRRFLEAIE